MELTVVLLPGLDGTGDLFAPFVAAAPPGVKTVVVKYPLEEASFDVLAQHVRERLADRCIVIAESFSGPIGVRVAADPKVRALVLCNSFVRSPVLPLLRHVAIAPAFAMPIPRAALRYVLLGPYASPALVEETRRALRCLRAITIASRLRQVLKTDEQTRVRSLARPILYLRGLDDNLVSENCWEKLNAIRPDAQIVRIDGPHMLLQTKPRECWEAIVSFINCG